MRTTVRNTYYKDFGSGHNYISGLSLPKNADGITANYDFIDCDFHPGTVGIFKDCTINGVVIPNGIADRLDRYH